MEVVEDSGRTRGLTIGGLVAPVDDLLDDCATTLVVFPVVVDFAENDDACCSEGFKHLLFGNKSAGIARPDAVALDERFSLACCTDNASGDGRDEDGDEN